MRGQALQYLPILVSSFLLLVAAQQVHAQQGPAETVSPDPGASVAFSGEQPAPSEAAAPVPPIRYVLQGIKVYGNRKTDKSVILAGLGLKPGEVWDVEENSLEGIRWRLLGSGLFNSVRFRLEKARVRGHVWLIVEVEERNTFLIENVGVGLAEGVQRSGDDSPELEPFFGIAVAERNFLGQGLVLSGATALSPSQQAYQLRVYHPTAIDDEFALNISAYFANAREFFGGDDVRVSIQCPPVNPANPEPCPEEILAKNAVVNYHRFALGLGTGHEISTSLRYTLDWQGELIDVGAMPDAASQLRGDEIVPIDFSIDPDVSLASIVQLGLIWDKRDNPSFPTRGLLLRFRGDVASQFLLSDYDFIRMQVQARHWFMLPWKHVFRVGAYGGALFGRAPFFYKFYVADLSDLLPSRMLGLNFDRRLPPSVLNTAAQEMHKEDLAARIDFEYAWPLRRSAQGTRAIDLFFGSGLYFIASRRDLEVAIDGYDRLAAIPVDLTFDFGVRIDTDVGVFQIAFSNLLGFFVL